MSRRFQRPRGTFDLLPPDSEFWVWLENVAREIFGQYGYREMRTPVFEARELFERGVGTTTDIVEKQMYVFQDRGGDWLALRPEGTAPILRAVVENGLHMTPPPHRYLYIGPMFRHERPQKGRFRQFHQIGVESLNESAPEIDAEIIAMAHQFCRTVGVTGVQIEINSIGCRICRPAYMQALGVYWISHLDRLCDDCRRRAQRNPLRVLDCKQPQCRALILDAPRIDDYWCGPCRVHFEAVLHSLERLDVPVQRNRFLVRGLDYYMRTTFEFTIPEERAQNAILGGGRYDGLLADLGGPDWPGIGFAIGVERLIDTLHTRPQTAARPVQIVVLAIGEIQRMNALQIAQQLRAAGLRVWAYLEATSVRSGMRRAHRCGAPLVVLVGEDEQRAGTWTVRDMRSGEQQTLTPDAAVQWICTRIRE